MVTDTEQARMDALAGRSYTLYDNVTGIPARGVVQRVVPDPHGRGPGVVAYVGVPGGRVDGYFHASLRSLEATVQQAAGEWTP